MKRFFTFYQFFIVLIFSCFSTGLFAQNAIIGSGFTPGWNSNCTHSTNFEYFSASAGGSQISIQNPNGTGNQYFRLGIDWGGTVAQNTITNQQDVQVEPNQEYTMNSSCTSSGAMFIGASSQSQNFVFKTLNAGSNPDRKMIIFRIDGAVRSINSVSRNFSTVLSGLSPTITANLDNAFNTGQGVYLRYTTNGWTNSTVVAMTGSGTSYSANIPTFAVGTNVSYYVFTSGSNLSIAHEKADWYTINLHNNGGSNYQYTVAAGPTYYQTAGNVDFSSPTNWLVGDGSTWVNATSAPTSTNIINIVTGNQLSISDARSISQLNVAANGTLLLQPTAQLTLTGAVQNDGIITLENGATLVQSNGSTLAGTNGTYNVKQTITGAGTTTPTGRFWYLGSPVASASSAVLLSNAINILKRRNEQTSQWETVSTGNLEVGKGYYLQASNGSASAGNITLTFTGGSLNNSPTASPMTISGLSRTAGQGFEGFNLVANPYPSYLDWDAVTKTDVGNTMWYRTFNSTNNTMVFDTYVAGTNGIGTNLNGAGVSNLVPPMQSFWVRVNSGSTSGSLSLTNSMRAHFTSINGSTAGLKSTSNERDLFLRMNLLQANKKDQIIVYVNETATNGFDILDGEKMMQAGMPQFYTSAAGKKITINGLNSAKKQQSLPITLELPTTGVHSFVIEDLEIDNGLVWLEDKQEESMQALEPGTVYEFYANSGINADRFVLHFQLIDNTTPINVYNEVNGSANFSGKGASVHAESAGVVVIKLPATTEGITDIQIRDAAGKLVYTGATNTLETSVQLEQANGIYYVTLNSASGVEVRKVFIQQ